MTSQGGHRQPERRPDVEAVDVDGELVLWDPLSRKVHRLDPVGSLFWPFLDGETSLVELAEDAADVWDVPIGQAEAALSSLIEQLDAAGLLVGRHRQTDAPADPRYLVDPPSP